MAAYLKLERSTLSQRMENARSLLQNCHVCPRNCGVNRLAGETGKCRTGRQAMVSSHGPHFGEESPLVGRYGSGTIFFSHCNLKCCYCQNYTISQFGEGTDVTSEELADMMLSLQDIGCHNINLVSPTHVAPQILEALIIAIDRGLIVPLVYNTGGYDSLETLRILDGIVDIYMPDMKYAYADIALKLSGVENYPEVNRAAVKEMHRQVGDLQIDRDGVALRGLLIRHLVLPQRLAGTRETMQFIAEEISPDSYVNVMNQYRPCYRSSEHPELTRPVSRQEYAEAIQSARQVGFNRLDEKHPVFMKMI